MLDNTMNVNDTQVILQNMQVLSSNLQTNSESIAQYADSTEAATSLLSGYVVTASFDFEAFRCWISSVLSNK